MNRTAWATLAIKSVDAEQRIVEGIASTPTVDRGGDSMDPAGAMFTLPIPFLWKHKDPIGEVFAAVVRPDGIHIKARVSTVAAGAPSYLKDRIEEAWHSFTAKPPLVRGLSIGWSPLQFVAIKGTPFIRHVKWIWGELSAVVVPMNVQASILSVKSLDAPYLAASGTRSSVALHLPGVSGQRKAPTMTISEQVTAEKTNLQIKFARLEELMTQDETEGGLDEAASTERDTLTKEVPGLTTKVQRLSALEAAQAAMAGTVSYHHAPVVQRAERTAPRVEVITRPKGQIFTRYAMAVAAGKGSMSDTLAYAKRFTDTPEVLAYIKAVEGTSVVSSPAWGGELVNPSTVDTEFVELLRPKTIVGRVPGFRNIPFNIPIITQTGGSTFDWVGEGGVKPVGELSFERTTLGHSKVAGIVVLTEELVRLSRPDAEATVRNDLIEQCAQFLDQQFVTPTVTATATRPASITNGVASPAATGADLDSFRLDMSTALGLFDTAEIPTDDLVIITTPAIARGISMYVNPLGQTPTGFGVTPQGGTLFGYTVIVSASVPAGLLIIIKPSEIFLADDGRVTLDASNQATLDMAGGATPTFNLWQRNCVGIRAERWIRWQKRRADAVAVIDTASYGPSVGSP